MRSNDGSLPAIGVRDSRGWWKVASGPWAGSRCVRRHLTFRWELWSSLSALQYWPRPAAPVVSRWLYCSCCCFPMCWEQACSLVRCLLCPWATFPVPWTLASRTILEPAAECVWTLYHTSDFDRNLEIIFKNKKKKTGTRERPWWLRSPFPEDPGSILSTPHGNSSSRAPGPSSGLCGHSYVYKHTWQAKDPCTKSKIIILFLKAIKGPGLGIVWKDLK